MTPEVRKILLEVRRVNLCSEDKWTTHSWARDKAGESVSVYDGDACAFCLGGAVINAADRLGLSEHQPDALQALMPCGLIILWNDDPDRTFTEVSSLLDKVLAQ